MWERRAAATARARPPRQASPPPQPPPVRRSARLPSRRGRSRRREMRRARQPSLQSGWRQVRQGRPAGRPPRPGSSGGRSLCPEGRRHLRGSPRPYRAFQPHSPGRAATASSPSTFPAPGHGAAGRHCSPASAPRVGLLKGSCRLTYTASLRLAEKHHCYNRAPAAPITTHPTYPLRTSTS